MSGWILVAIASAHDTLTEGDVETLRAVAKAAGEFVWLAPGRAVEIPFAGDIDNARAAFASRAIDINAISTTNRRKKILIADMDSTIINCEVIDELADFAHLKPQIAAITARAVAGEIPFEDAVRERIALLRGLPLDRVRRVYAERVRLNPGARELVATMRAHGAYTMLVSGGYTYFTSRVAADAGFDMNEGNTLLDDGNVLTGVKEPILGRPAKLETLSREANARGITLDECLAVGDGANDLAMIEAAGLGVAYHAKPIVAAAADAQVTHGDLTALLYLQGYRDDEIVRA